MGKQKKVRKFAEMKRLLNPKDVKPYVYYSTPIQLCHAWGFAACQGPGCTLCLTTNWCHCRPDKKITKDSDKQVKHM